MSKKRNFRPEKGGEKPAEQVTRNDKSVFDLSERKRGRPHSKGLRSRVVFDVQAGESPRKAAARYGLSVSTVGKWVLRFRRTGSLAAKPMGGDRYRCSKDERNRLLRTIAAEPGLTLAELHQRLRAHGVRVSYLSVKRFLNKEKIKR